MTVQTIKVRLNNELIKDIENKIPHEFLGAFYIELLNTLRDACNISAVSKTDNEVTEIDEGVDMAMPDEASAIADIAEASAQTLANLILNAQTINGDDETSPEDEEDQEDLDNEENENVSDLANEISDLLIDAVMFASNEKENQEILSSITPYSNDASASENFVWTILPKEPVLFITFE